jgi:hypothetical protein
VGVIEPIVFIMESMEVMGAMPSSIMPVMGAMFIMEWSIGAMPSAIMPLMGVIDSIMFMLLMGVMDAVLLMLLMGVIVSIIFMLAMGVSIIMLFIGAMDSIMLPIGAMLSIMGMVVAVACKRARRRSTLMTMAWWAAVMVASGMGT